MSSTNLVSLTLGPRSGKIKWDSTWNLVAWLLDPSESHGLGHVVLSGLTNQVFGEALKDCEIQTEQPIGFDDNRKSKWPDLTLFFPTSLNPSHVIVMDDVDERSPGSTRKLTNLSEYGRIAKKKYPHAIIRVVAVTNAVTSDKINKVTTAIKKRLGDNSNANPDATPWHLVPLCTIGEWAKAAQS
ncbi:MAG: hypothetical protein WCE58_00120, partial [Gallionella sp.]